MPVSLGMQLKCISASNSPSCLIPEPLCGAGVPWDGCGAGAGVSASKHMLCPKLTTL